MERTILIVEEVSAQLEDILKRKFDINIFLSEEAKDIPLTASPFMFNSFQLYELLMIIEERYQKYFSVSEIKRNGFSTFNDVVNLILG